MVNTVVKIDGMSCSMCESHINDVIRRNFQVKKVTSSHKKACSEIVSEEPIDEALLRKVIAETGYTVTAVSTEKAEKKQGFHLFGR